MLADPCDRQSACFPIHLLDDPLGLMGAFSPWMPSGVQPAVGISIKVAKELTNIAARAPLEHLSYSGVPLPLHDR